MICKNVWEYFSSVAGSTLRDFSVFPDLGKKHPTIGFGGISEAHKSAALCTTVHSYAGVLSPTDAVTSWLSLHIHCTTPLYTACATLLLKPQLKKGN